MADVNFDHVISYVISNVLSLRFVYGRLGDLQITAYFRHYSGAASVYFDDADNATCQSRVGLPIPCWRSQTGLFSASAVNVREAHEYMRAIQPCNTHLYCIVVT